MESALELTAASPLWDTVATNDIPPEYLLLAILGVAAPHIEVPSGSYTILSLWIKGIPIVLDRLPSDNEPSAPPPIDNLAKVA
jgi:hypothetical protein